MAVMISGWKELPQAGDEVLQAEENDIKKAIINRQRRRAALDVLDDATAINAYRRAAKVKRDAELAEREATPFRREPPRLASQEKPDDAPKELRLILKCDVSGSVEAIAGVIDTIGNTYVNTKIIHTGVGDVTESDVMLAKTAEAMIIGFSVQVPRALEQMAHQAKIPIHSSKIIYRIIEEVTDRLCALLPPLIEKKVTGEADVLQLFDITQGKRIVKVAGCRVTNGLVQRDKVARVVRQGTQIFEGPLDTLRHHKKDMTEITKGMECGLSIAKFDDLQAGDLIQMLHIIEKPATLHTSYE